MVDSLTGVFVGLTHGDYQLLAADAHAVEAPYGFTGSSFSLASGRIAYALGVHGPALTVDTACSSGLTAVHLACHSLIDGESDLALAGGAAVIRGPAANQDGRTVNIATPSVTAQTAVYRAVAAAGVDASSIGMVEAHGPGTPVGDPHP
jgi:polyketide synthase 5